MKRILSLCLLVFMVAVLTSCFDRYYLPGLILDGWQGADVNVLITSWGPPSDTYTMPNGDKMYSWLRIGGTQVTTNYGYYWNQVRSSAVTVWCKISFTVSGAGKVTHGRCEGNNYDAVNWPIRPMSSIR
jgi:hypothetical protein